MASSGIELVLLNKEIFKALFTLSDREKEKDVGIWFQEEEDEIESSIEIAQTPGR